MRKRKIAFLLILSSVFFWSQSIQLFSQTETLAQKGTVYVPAYSSIFYGNLINEFALAITLAIHNTDLKNNITIEALDYFDTSGQLIQKYVLEKKIVLKPMETYILGIKEVDYRGGIGANFIIRWQAAKKVNRPIIETIMTGRKEQLGISFTSRGVNVSE